MRVTVAITTYNQAPFLERTLRSVLAQTRAPDEILVVDDGSTDDTPAVLQRVGDRIRIVRQRNRGIARARNRAVQEATGDMVALLDGDDLWHPHKLEQCLGVARELPAPVIVHDAEMMTVDEREGPMRGPVEAFLRRDRRCIEPARLECWEALVHTNFVWTTSQVLIDRRLYLEEGMSDPRFRTGSDYDLYLRLARRTEFLVIPTVLCRWRQHDASATGAGSDRAINTMREIVRVLRAQTPPATPGAAALLRDRAASMLAGLNAHLYGTEFDRGSWATATRLLRVAIDCHAVSSAMLAGAVLCPFAIRHAAAVLTGYSVSSTMDSGTDAAARERPTRGDH